MTDTGEHTPANNTDEHTFGDATVNVPVILDADTSLGYAKEGDAGADLASRVDITLKPGQRALIPTGVRAAIPNGYAGFVHPRSGISHRLGLGIVNSPGVVDAGYRGEILVSAINFDLENDIHITAGTRIAQLVIQPVAAAHFTPVSELGDTDRGETGFGSSGT